MGAIWLCSVITENDISRAAQLMLRWSCDTESIRRIDELSATGDFAGVAVWLRIIEAIDQLATITPPGPVH
jgi:hypothetical protein